jgi:hypothetical protein
MTPVLPVLVLALLFSIAAADETTVAGITTTTAAPWYILDPKPILDFFTSQAAVPVLLGLIFTTMMAWSIVAGICFFHKRVKGCRGPATNRDLYRAGANAKGEDKMVII